MKILYVEDDKYLGESIARLLETRGHDVTVVRSFAKALEATTHNFFDATISDWDLGFDAENKCWNPTGDVVCVELRKYQPDTKYYIFSGLERECPEGIEFIGKDNINKLLKVFS